MAPLLTTGQSRWVLHIILGLLSAVAIASSAPSAMGGMSPPFACLRCVRKRDADARTGVTMLSGNPGDIRGVEVLVGAIGLGGVLVLYVL
jgi:hypothetical protein